VLTKTRIHTEYTVYTITKDSFNQYGWLLHVDICEHLWIYLIPVDYPILCFNENLQLSMDQL